MRFLFIVSLLFTFASSSLFDFKQTKEIFLKKDELKKISVNYEDKNKKFTFRWTLYKNNGLVVFHSYDTIVSQHILYLNHTNQSFRVSLKPSIDYNEPYILLRFIEFNDETKEARFELLLSDRVGNIQLEYDKEKE